jgi:hypothetical protein
MLETGQVFQTIRRASVSIGLGASLGLATAIPASYASDSLVGRAVLPAATFAEGSTSGQQPEPIPLTTRVYRSLTSNRCKVSRRFVITAMAHFG